MTAGRDRIRSRDCIWSAPVADGANLIKASKAFQAAFSRPSLRLSVADSLHSLITNSGGDQNVMSSQIRIIKKDRDKGLAPPPVGSEMITDRQRIREMAAVVKSWIAEFELRRQSSRLLATVEVLGGGTASGR